ncbi:NUDIX domain-containing protein [Rossellomorea sp. DA94]|uniref:NUDIX domain-containing protein n=1 Tax=Rossellomorea sp. DA94 TaxID=3038653 RepID=UPI00244AC81D|nr:NUDIX domain-containing protein [Rossellomorea sp. DA94]WGG47985.1 NUDIX domain-containing protein [Rossellomorea sp. DA94]
MDSTYVWWGESKVKLTWRQDSILPDTSRVTSVHGFCLKDGKMHLVNLQKRGWDFPGGHLEKGESPEGCLKREVMEEAYVSGSSHFLGYLIVDHHDNLHWNEQSPYPKVGFQLFYRVDVEEIYTFETEYESAERCWIDPDQVADYYSGWNGVYEEILSHTRKINV